jgi:hypothetical protein
MDIYFGFILFLFGCSFVVGYYTGHKAGDKKGYFEGCKEVFEDIVRRESAQPLIKELLEEYGD